MFCWLGTLLDAANAKSAGFSSDKISALVSSFNEVLFVLANTTPKPPPSLLQKKSERASQDISVHGALQIENKQVFLSQPLYLGLRIVGIMVDQGLEGDGATLAAVRKLMYPPTTQHSTPMLVTPIEPHQLLLALPSIIDQKSKPLPPWIKSAFENHHFLTDHAKDVGTGLSLESSLLNVLRGKFANSPIPLFGFCAPAV